MKRVIIALSVGINLLVALLYFLPGYSGVTPDQVNSLPAVNAFLNCFTFLFLCAAYWRIRRGDIKGHRRFILAAFGTTTLFFLSYVTYHALSESTRYGGEGLLRYLYYFLLLSHILLAILIVPLALFSLAYGLTMQVERHRRIVRFTMPLWLYVSSSGVLVYWLIRPFYQ